MEEVFDYSRNELMSIAIDALPKYIYFENFSAKEVYDNGWVPMETGFNGQEFECTKCGYKWTVEGRIAEHKGIVTCPECENTETAYNRKLGRTSRKIHINLVLFKMENYNSVWAECVRVDAENFTDIYSPHISFQKRALYHFMPGFAQKYKFDVGWKKYRPMKSCNGYKFWVQQMTARCHEEDYDVLMSLDVLNNSFLRYSSLNNCPKDYLLEYVALCCTAPAFSEFFSKTGLWDVIKAKINKDVKATENIKLKAAAFSELLPKLNKSAQKRLVKYITSGNAPPSLDNFTGALSYLGENTPDGFNKIEEIWGNRAGKAAGIIAITKGSRMICDNKHEDECIRYQTAIDNLRLSESRLSEAVVKRDKIISEKTTDINLLIKELKYQHEQKEILSDVIVRMRTQPEAEKKLKERLPYGMTNMIRFMDYRKLDVKSSDQYRLQQECDTGVLEGIRIYNDGENDYYCAAMGSAYGRDIGDTWHVTLACGTEFDIILADYKDNGVSDYFGHPDLNYDGRKCTNVIEFVVDKDKIPSAVKSAGTFTVQGYYGGKHGNGGNICKIEYTGRVWE